MSRKPRGRSVWLVLWEKVGTHVEIPREIAAVISSRRSPDAVREIVELLYAYENLSAGEKLRNVGAKQKVYPAEFDTISGIPWKGEIRCGHNPCLVARRVDDFIVNEDESIMYSRRVRPKFNLELRQGPDF